MVADVRPKGGMRCGVEDAAPMKDDDEVVVGIKVRLGDCAALSVDPHAGRLDCEEGLQDAKGETQDCVLIHEHEKKWVCFDSHINVHASLDVVPIVGPHFRDRLLVSVAVSSVLAQQVLVDGHKLLADPLRQGEELRCRHVDTRGEQVEAMRLGNLSLAISSARTI